jgi:hypothetical protein
MKEIRLHTGEICLVDNEDYDALRLSDWRMQRVENLQYAYAGRLRLMHREVMQAKPGQIIDHIDGNGLRFVTHAQNMQNRRFHRNNTSGWKGVYLNKASGRWRAEIKANGQKIRLGTFDTAEAAGRAYLKAASELHGLYARAA